MVITTLVPSLADSLLYTYRMLDCEFEVVDSFDVPISGEYPDYPVQVLVSNGNISEYVCMAALYL